MEGQGLMMLDPGVVFTMVCVGALGTVVWVCWWVMDRG
jgi:hypothetical protein